MIWPMSPTEWDILDELDRGVLKWGAAVAATWKNLTAHVYVERNFGDITVKGRATIREKRRIDTLLAKLRGGSMDSEVAEGLPSVVATMAEAADEIVRLHRKINGG